MPDTAVDLPVIEDFPFIRDFPTRWNDNDMFGHVNNTIYYAAMDTACTNWFDTEAGLDPMRSDWIAVLVSSSCRFHESAVFPDVIRVGVRAERIGRTSLTWRFGLFREARPTSRADVTTAHGDGALLATGEFVHVVVAREGARRPIPVPDHVRDLVNRTMLRPAPVPAT
jgi:acyl-CoA thioester hydrolase